MTDDELTIRAHADRLRYQDTPCGCPACVEAGVSHRPVRYVPTLVDGVEDRVRWRGREDSTVAGHWAHGEELARYYAAKDACIVGWPRKFRRVLQLITRDPGEEG